MNTFKLLQTLSEAVGPSGFEQEIADVVMELWQPLVDTLARDRVGSLVACKYGAGSAPRPRLLLAAHMDEIGLMVKQIVPQGAHGFLRVTGLGGVDRRHLYGQMVDVHGQRRLPGVLGGLPAAMRPDKQTDDVLTYDELVVDVGLPMSALRELVAVGDFVSFRQPLRKLQNKHVSGKALDNRASLAAVTLALEYLQARRHEWDVVAVATCQEETRLLGAFTSGYAERPDAAVAIDVTFGKGTGVSSDEGFVLGGGPVIDLGPNVHPGMFKQLHEVAKSLEMKVTTATHSRGSGTDAYGLQVARAGVPTGLVSIPLRNMHTMVEVVHLSDVERSGRLLGEFCAQLDASFLENLAAGMLDKDNA
ncbi:MAG: hypothetical protein KC425_01930 [Anaerolineales bacterium]|nr:hypothetical protein [Anaerolineales bacterium]